MHAPMNALRVMSRESHFTRKLLKPKLLCFGGFVGVLATGVFDLSIVMDVYENVQSLVVFVEIVVQVVRESISPYFH